MTANAETYLDLLERICTGTIAPHAIEVDRQGAFPAASMDALRDAGLWGLISAPAAGGLGLGPRAAVGVVRRVAQECGSTAMVLTMHYCAVAVLEALASPEVRQGAATGGQLATLAFSESGSRSHFWAPIGTATADGSEVVLNARKSWVTSASRAAWYVWSSRPLDAEGLSTIWLVPANAAGIAVQGPFDGLGLRGNDSSPVSAEGVRVPREALLGTDGKGFDVMMGVVLPLFNVLNAACSLGLTEAAVSRTANYAGGARYDHLNSALADLPTIRNYIARMRVKTDMASTLLDDTLAAMETSRPDTMLRVLECKAAAGETATEVLDLAMRVCAGVAFRKDIGVERYFRDTRAAGVMAPTTDVLYDFIGKAACGMSLF